VTEVRGYHAHVYYEPATRDVAERLREEIGARFTVELGRMHDKPVGPHPAPMFQAAFGCDELAKILPWLMLHRAGLAVMVHPRTGDELADHSTNPLWLGAPLPLDLEFLRAHVARLRRFQSAPS
jgi:DOPA 4,5-dioxygenase